MPTFPLQALAANFVVGGGRLGQIVTPVNSLSLFKWSVTLLPSASPIANSDSPNGFATNVTQIRRVGTATATSSFGEEIVYGEFELDFTLTYPDSVDDTPDWTDGMNVGFICRAPNSAIDYEFSRIYWRPSMGLVWNSVGENVYDTEKRKHETVNGHTATWQGGIWAQCKECHLEKLSFDWGDGQSEEKALTSRPRTDADYANGYFVNFLGELPAPFSHTFPVDEFNDGSGNPVSVRVTDVWGRRSRAAKTNVRPEAKVKISVDPQNGDFIFDTSDSYGRTGKIVKRELRLFDNALYFGFSNFIAPDLTLDARGRKFRVALATAGSRYFRVDIEDEAARFTNYSFLKTPIQWLYPMLSIQRPPENFVSLLSGALMLATEIGSGTFFRQFFRFYRSERGTLPENVFPYHLALSPLDPKNSPYGNRTLLRDVAAPRLAIDGAALYCAGRHKSGQTRLWRSRDQAREWEELSMIWTAEYFHADMDLLVGGGACSVACKRIERPSTPFEQKKYHLEFWFRKTFNVKNWESAPVKIATYDARDLSLQETLQTYPQIVNQALSGGSNTLLIRLTGFAPSYFYESDNLGATWRGVAS